MWLSNTRLNLILKDQASYFMRYKAGLDLKVKKPALTIGTNVHWGLEHDTYDLRELLGKNDYEEYTQDEILAECMDAGFLNVKDKVYNDILENGRYKLMKEEHELSINAKLKSFKYAYPHTFNGILDLLWLVEDTTDGSLAFIILDYKTASASPNWDGYLDQLYRYIFLVHDMYPQIPVIKIGIIALLKSKIKQKAGESNTAFRSRLMEAYVNPETKYIDYHLFEANKLNQKAVDQYLNNLSLQADLAQTIDEGGVFPINYQEINGMYGRGDFADIFEGIEGSYSNYKVKDLIFDPNGITSYEDENGDIREEQGILTFSRDAKEIDMNVLYDKSIVHNYNEFVSAVKVLCNGTIPSKEQLNDEIKKLLFDALKENKTCDDELLEIYWVNLHYNDVIEARRKEAYDYV